MMLSQMKPSQNSSKQQMASNEEGSGLPSLKKDLQNAKLFLMQCGASGISLFDHLSNVIARVIDERPHNVVDCFELYSERVRLETFAMGGNSQGDELKDPERLANAQKLLALLTKEKSKQAIKVDDDEQPEELAEQEEEEDEEVIYHEPPLKDLCELQFYWNLLGIGFPRDELFLLEHSMARFKIENSDIASCRFWGKLLGLKNDYYVIECAFTEAALELRIDSDEKAINIMSLEPNGEEFVQVPTPASFSQTKVENNDDKDNGSDLRAEAGKYPAGWNFSLKASESQYRPPVEIPAEALGHGVNRNVFYVSTDLTSEWIELPPATPHQINVSRRISKYLTGNLDESISSYPPFPGMEKHYLRALIARIAAGASISPRNYFKIGSKNEDDEEFDDTDAEDGSEALNNDKPIMENASYNPLPLSKLSKLDYWMHHKPEILKQGRVTFFDPRKLNLGGSKTGDFSDDDDEEDEDETDVANNETKTEMNPIPLFASCSGDRLANDVPLSPWTITPATSHQGLVLVRSNVWPGAFAFVKDRTCDNIYIGFGKKNSMRNYVPPGLPRLTLESSFASNEKEVEANDPTVEEEEAFAEKNKKKGDEENSDDSAAEVEDQGDQ